MSCTNDDEMVKETFMEMVNFLDVLNAGLSEKLSGEELCKKISNKIPKKLKTTIENESKWFKEALAKSEYDLKKLISEEICNKLISVIGGYEFPFNSFDQELSTEELAGYVVLCFSKNKVHKDLLDMVDNLTPIVKPLFSGSD